MNPLDTSNPFMTAYCKGAEARMISAEHLARMLKASGVKDMVVMARDTDLGRHLEDRVPSTFDEADDCLWGYLADRFAALERLTRFPREMREILGAWLLKYDAANVKAALHAVARPGGGAARMIPLGRIHGRGGLERMAAAADAEAIAAVVAECKLAAFAAPLAAWIAAADRAGRLRAEEDLTRQAFRALSTVARGYGAGSPLARAIGLLVDCANLQLTLRAIAGEVGPAAGDAAFEGGFSISTDLVRELLSLKLAEVPARLDTTPHGAAAAEIAAAWSRTSSLAAIEDVLAKHRFALLREALAARLLSPVLIAWYIALKETETRNVRLLFKAQFDGLPPDRVKESLVPIW